MQDSLNQFNTNDIRILLQPLYVTWKGETGGDSGGLRREWFTMLIKSLTDPLKGLFQLTPSQKAITINVLSISIPDYIQYFRLIGIILGKVNSIFSKY